MPVYFNRLEAIPPFPITGNITSSTSTFQHRLIRLLFFVGISHRDSIPFLVPIILSVHIFLGFCYSPASLVMPVTSHGRSEGKFLLNHTNYALTYPYISIWSSSRTVHSQIRQYPRQGIHSNHEYFIESWSIGNIPHR